ncbi:MAG TPA: carboxylating nicotinate-nucleotide diphosphorylase [Alphaproteobacteria bacterium]|jgi:nicotinate-nucleotide pyrophosphorylase (carboxylating)|nr:carboxylating nicotinate-nucleotide diphosphorylase [Alphaproteobacteria bacterium]
MLPHYVIRQAVQRALDEDIGRGDITTDALIAAAEAGSARLVARQDGIIAGMDFAEAAFRILEGNALFEHRVDDGQPVTAGTVVGRVTAKVRTLLSAERVALNFLTHMSGIATLTGRYVAAVAGTKARIVDTRKTLPGLRVVQKYAVKAGGGANHRFALDDAAMLKDNHIAAAGGIGQAIRQVRAANGHMVKICCEVDRIDQIEEALGAGVDVLLLDNMTPAQLGEAVKLIGGRAVVEASGGVSLDTVAAIAASGVDVISVGRLTHSAPVLDIALDFE